MMSINAVKGVEIGDGFAAARLRGEQNADPMRPGNEGNPVFLANHAGGIAGGISTGQPVKVRIAFQPTNPLLIPVQTVTSEGEPSDNVTQGSHDTCDPLPCLPVDAPTMALVLADLNLRPSAKCCT